jgi:hypothetical protein
MLIGKNAEPVKVKLVRRCTEQDILLSRRTDDSTFSFYYIYLAVNQLQFFSTAIKIYSVAF